MNSVSKVYDYISQNPGCSVADVASKCGFETKSHANSFLYRNPDLFRKEAAENGTKPKWFINGTLDSESYGLMMKIVDYISKNPNVNANQIAIDIVGEESKRKDINVILYKMFYRKMINVDQTAKPPVWGPAR